MALIRSQVLCHHLTVITESNGDFDGDSVDSGTESEPGLRDSVGQEQSHSGESSGALVSCYTKGFTCRYV